MAKTAISLPDALFRETNALARRLKISRSELIAKALAAFVVDLKRRAIRDNLNRVYDRQSSRIDPVLARLQGASLPREDW